MFPLLYGLLLLFCQALSSPARYDQRQEGDVNVQIDLKDVKIIALLKSDMFDDYMNYDYAYDYADFTIKPIGKPTTKPPAVTTSIKSTASSAPVSSTSGIHYSEIASSSTSAATPIQNENKTVSITLKNADESENQFEKDIKTTDEVPNTITTTVASLEKPEQVPVQRPAKRCRSGLDKSGRCRRRKISLIPLAMKVAPELVRSIRQRIVL